MLLFIIIKHINQTKLVARDYSDSYTENNQLIIFLAGKKIPSRENCESWKSSEFI